MFLEIEKVTATANGKPILKGLSLSVPRGGINVIMGPNGSGKSTLCGVIMGHPDYVVSAGSITFENNDLLKLKTDERARRGIFLSFQYPREIPGVSLAQVVRAAMKTAVSSQKFIKDLKAELGSLGLSEEFLRRSLNENASGGEKKRLEMVQLAMLAPKLAILDEIDSGLDIDAMQTIAKAITSAAEKNDTTFLIITHYQRLLRHLRPDSIHIMVDGKIAKSGDYALAEELERDGYKNFVSSP